MKQCRRQNNKQYSKYKQQTVQEKHNTQNNKIQT